MCKTKETNQNDNDNVCREHLVKSIDVGNLIHVAPTQFPWPEKSGINPYHARDMVSHTNANRIRHIEEQSRYKTYSKSRGDYAYQLHKHNMHFLVIDKMPINKQPPAYLQLDAFNALIPGDIPLGQQHILLLHIMNTPCSVVNQSDQSGYHEQPDWYGCVLYFHEAHVIGLINNTGTWQISV